MSTQVKLYSVVQIHRPYDTQEVHMTSTKMLCQQYVANMKTLDKTLKFTIRPAKKSDKQAEFRRQVEKAVADKILDKDQAEVLLLSQEDKANLQTLRKMKVGLQTKEELKEFNRLVPKHLKKFLN